ncbi:MAG: binary toxin-like calcium binding domain-containing protein [bacterium]
MFDDIQKEIKPTPQTSAPDHSDESDQIFGVKKTDSEPEDIFDEIDDEINSQEVDYPNQPPNIKLTQGFEQNEEYKEMQGLSGKKNSKIKIFIIITIVFLTAIGAAWLAYAYFIIQLKSDNAIEKNNIETEKINNADNLPASANTNDQDLNKNTTNAPIEIVAPIDTDGDGLTDKDEIKFGTDAKLIDTDSDGLTDKEEVIKYKTNPHSTDSDNDGYTDGEEIKNGYNPNGDGKLIDKIELP